MCIISVRDYAWAIPLNQFVNYSLANLPLSERSPCSFSPLLRPTKSVRDKHVEIGWFRKPNLGYSYTRTIISRLSSLGRSWNWKFFGCPSCLANFKVFLLSAGLGLLWKACQLPKLHFYNEFRTKARQSTKYVQSYAKLHAADASKNA